MRKILAAVMILVGVTSCEAMSLREKVGQLFLIRPDQLDTRMNRCTRTSSARKALRR